MSIEIGNTVNAYIQQDKTIMRKTIVKSKTVDAGIRKMPGVKSQATLNFIDSGYVVIQDGSNCAWNPSAQTNVSQRVLTTKPMMVQESYCPKKFLNTFLEYELNLQAGNTTFPAEQQFIDERLDSIAQLKDIMMWQSSTGSSTSYLAFTTGFIELIDDSGIAIDGNVDSVSASTGITYSNIIDIILGMIQQIPVKDRVKKNLKLFCGEEVFFLLTKAIFKGDYRNIQLDQNALQDMKMIFPLNPNIEVVGVTGLNNTNRMFLSYADNFVYGFDLDAADTKAEFWYSVDNREFRLEVLWNAGYQIAYPQDVVQFQLT